MRSQKPNGDRTSSAAEDMRGPVISQQGANKPDQLAQKKKAPAGGFTIHT